MKREYTDKMDEISGFGGSYETACRMMVLAGLTWIDENPDCDLHFKHVKFAYGLITGNSGASEELMNAMIAVNHGCSGAQMEACITHVLYIKENGWEKYCSEMKVG